MPLDTTTTVAVPAVAETPAAPAPSTQPQLSERESQEKAIQDARDAVWAKHESGETEPETPAAEAKPAKEVKRGPDGKFKPKEDVQQAVEAPAEGEETAGQEAEDVEPLPMPNSWSPKLADEWAKTPVRMQELIHRREEQMARYMGSAGQRAKAFEPFAKVADEHRDWFSKVGVKPTEAFGNLVRTARYLDDKPAEALRWLAKEHGVKPAEIFGDPLDWDAPGQSSQQRAPDPELGAVKSQVQDLRRQNEELMRELRGVSSNVAQRERAALEEQHEQSRQLVGDYEKENPDLRDLTDDLVPLIETFRRRNPRMPKQQLLDKAVRAARAMNPERLAKVAEDKARREEKTRAEAAAAAAKKARQSSSVNVRSSPRNTAVPASLNAARDEIWDKHHPRG